MGGGGVISSQLSKNAMKDIHLERMTLTTPAIVTAPIIKSQLTLSVVNVVGHFEVGLHFSFFVVRLVGKKKVQLFNAQ